VRKTLLAVLVAALAMAAPTPAAARFERIAGVKSAGTPAKYNEVGVLEFGSRKARNVLILNPGTSASAAYFAPLARDLVKKAKGWQVWAVERRENLIEDQSELDRYKNGEATPKQLFDYYLGYLKDPSVTQHFQTVADPTVAFAREWGMNVAVEDLHRVIDSAKAVGGKVVLGGHSLGGTLVTAYATWDFGGTPGADGLAGLVYVDGGSTPTAEAADKATSDVKAIQAGSPWLTFGGIGAPYAGVFNATGSLGALLHPDEPSLGQASGLLPKDIVPADPVTNAGQYGYALNVATSPASLAAAQGWPRRARRRGGTAPAR
jgi:pimeloyl-ACP methyl ester carboxylesterase